MSMILERSQEPLGEIVNEVRQAQAFWQIEGLFKRLFGIPTSPDSYKQGGSPYGLKVRGKVAREKLNGQCRAILERVTSAEELTPEDREILLQYSGRGGLTVNSQYEYYTPTPVAEGVWGAMLANGFANGNVLDPCCGSGVFSGTKPGGVVMTANDLDPTGSRIAALLNPEDHISTQPFERVATSVADDTFDSAIGNVPFGNARGASMHEDPAYKKERLIERYFILRILDKIKPGGLACLVCPTNIVGNTGRRWEEFRIALSKKAEFLGAHKLPSKTFSAQGTDTVVDVVVLRKHGRDLLDKIEDIPFDTLKRANVVWDEFVKGRYWSGEGRQFIMGKYIPKKAGERFSREIVDGEIDSGDLKAKLAQKFSSRIDWDILDMAEPITRAYAEGDRRSIGEIMYELRGGAWERVQEESREVAIDASKYGAESVEALESLLKTPAGALSLSADQAFAVYKVYPHLLSSQQVDAVLFAMGQAKESCREQVYRGSLIGSMIAKMGADEAEGADVSETRKALQELVVGEIEKYGHPSNNSVLSLMGEHSRAFGVFQGAVRLDGTFSELLAGTLDKRSGREYDPANIGEIVSYLYLREDRQDITIEDIKALYTGPMALESLGDLAECETIAIDPDGTISTWGRYCSGDVLPKLTACAEAIKNVDDPRLQDKFRKQIEGIRKGMVNTATDDIAFGLRDKWFSKKYIVEFLRENGYPDATFGSFREVEVVQYDGSIEKKKRFVEDFDAEDGEFEGIPGVRFDGQFKKYLEGGNVTSSTQENIQAYREQVANFEKMFNLWMHQHPDIDELTEKFNLCFNSYVPYEHDGSPLGIDDILSGEIIPHNYQNAEVRRLSEQGAGICGFGVGLGKSFSALALAGYNFKKGRARRTCIVVPSAVLENWYHESRQFYSSEYMDTHVFFVGLEPKRDKDGNILRKPILDERGEPRKTRSGEPLLQDQVVFRNAPQDIFEAMWSIPQSNFSLVVMTKEKFAAIPLRPSTKKAYTDEMVSRHLMSARNANKVLDTGKRSYKEDKELLNLQSRFSDDGTKKKGELPYLEDMGFDSIITDESHFFKNSLEAGETSQGIAYMPTAPTAQIAVDMAMKSHYIRSMTGGCGVYGLTATPVTNSPLEIFNMLSLVVSPDEFERFGVRTVDDFVNVFADIQTIFKQSVSGEIKQTLGITGFKNLDGLRNLFHKYVSVKTVADVDNEIHVPHAEEAEESVTISEEQAQIYAQLRKRAKSIVENRSKDDSIFSVIRDMDRLTTDVDMYHHTMTFNFPGEYKEAVANMVQGLPTSVKMNVTNEETGKAESQVVEFEPELTDSGDTVTLVVHELMEEAVLMAMKEAHIPEDRVSHPITPKYAKMLENLRKHLEAGGKQLIFTEEKSQHHKLKRIIVHHLPVSVEQIGIINADDAKGERLDKISKAYNAGQIKIVIANKKAEVGVNLQKGTVAIHHLTLPWTPASINQRNGRGVRQGNKVDTVSVYYYCGKGTFDSYRKELLQAKADWINELLTGTASHAKNGDLTGMEEMLDMLSDDPEAAKKARAERLAAEEAKRAEAAKSSLVNRLQILISIRHSLSTFDQRKEDRLRKITSDIKSLEDRLERAKFAGRSTETLENQIARLKATQSNLDRVFEQEKIKLESRKKQAEGVLRIAAKEGRLPFDSKLIDNPDNSVVSTSGEIFTVGEFWEFTNDSNSSGKIFKILAVDPKSRDIEISVMGSGYSHKILSTAKLHAKRVEYSESELNLKIVLSSGPVYYGKLPQLGITKQQYLDHADEISLYTYSGVVCMSNNGEYVLVASDNIPENHTVVWPEPENEDFRKRVFEKVVDHVHNGGSLWSFDSMLKELFGRSYRDELEKYKNNATEAEILNILVSAWEKAFGSDEDGNKEDRYKRALSIYSVSARQAFTEGGFDNVYDFSRSEMEFSTGKRAELAALEQERRREEERRALEALKSHPDYKEVPADLAAKFEELGLTVRVNTTDISLRYRNYRAQHFAAFSRYFVHDKAGIGGPLNRVKDILKARYDAKFTKDWSESPGTAWWHVPATVDLNEIYNLIA